MITFKPPLILTLILDLKEEKDYLKGLIPEVTNEIN